MPGYKDEYVIDLPVRADTLVRGTDIVIQQGSTVWWVQCWRHALVWFGCSQMCTCVRVPVVTEKHFSKVMLELAPKGWGGGSKPSTKGRARGSTGRGQKDQDAKVRNRTGFVRNQSHSVLLESGVQLERWKEMKPERQAGGAWWAGLMIWILS